MKGRVSYFRLLDLGAKLADRYAQDCRERPALARMDWYASVNACVGLSYRSCGGSLMGWERARARFLPALAILSPETGWERLLDSFLSDTMHRHGPMFWDRPHVDLPTVLGYRANKAKALLVLNGEPWANVVRERSSPKVFAFASNLLGDESCVTVDRHSALIALGRPLLRKSDYWAAVAAHRIAAEMASREGERVSPRDLQARTWVAHRERKEVAAG